MRRMTLTCEDSHEDREMRTHTQRHTDALYMHVSSSSYTHTHTFTQRHTDALYMHVSSSSYTQRHLRRGANVCHLHRGGEPRLEHPVREILQRDGSGVGPVQRRGADVRYEP